MQVKSSLHANTGCDWKGSFTGEEVQHAPDVQFQEVQLTIIILIEDILQLQYVGSDGVWVTTTQ